MKFQHLTLVFVVAGVLLLAACTGAGDAPAGNVNMAEQSQVVTLSGGGSYTDVSAEGLAAMMAEEDFPLINVHIPYAGEIEGTDLHIPYNEMALNLDELPDDKDERIVLYCRSGSMSSNAASTLVELGYTDVWNVDGGMIAWSNSGRELLNR